MNLRSRFKLSLSRFMQGRYGPDNLGMFTLILGLAVSIVGSFTGIPYTSLAGLILYFYTLFRMFSRNKEKRLAENRKYLAFTTGIRTKTRQFFKRLKNRKEYKYFRCPQCKVLLRLKRGTGEKEITCVRCSHQFHQKA